MHSTLRHSISLPGELILSICRIRGLRNFHGIDVCDGQQCIAKPETYKAENEFAVASALILGYKDALDNKIK